MGKHINTEIFHVNLHFMVSEIFEVKILFKMAIYMNYSK